MDLHCGGKRQAILLAAEGVVEFKCDSRKCGAQRGVVVLHRFSTVTGKLLSTRKFRNP